MATSPLRDSKVLTNISLQSEFLFLENLIVLLNLLVLADILVLANCSAVISSSKFSLPFEKNWLVEETLQLSTAMYFDH